MLRTCRLALILPLCFLIVAGFAPAAEADKYLLDDTDAVVALNVGQVASSPLFKKYYEEALRKTIAENKDIDKGLKDMGLDPLKSIERILLVHGENSHRIEEKGGKTDAGLFFIIHGKFDAAKLHAKADQIAKDIPDLLKIEKHGTQRLYKVTLAEPYYLALPDSTTIVASIFRDQVVEALDKGAGKKKSELKHKDFQALLAKADAKQSLWLVATGRMVHSFDKAVKVVNNKKVVVTVKDSLANAGVESITGGLTITDGIATELKIGVKDADTAKMATTFIQTDLTDAVGRAAKAAGEAKYLEPLRLILLALNIASEGKLVTVKGDVSAKEIADAFK